DYNSDCPDLSKALSKGCTVSSDCTKITCTVSDMGDKVLTTTIKINKCDDPVTIKVTVDASGFHWLKTFKSNERIGVPGLSMKALGVSAGVFVKVSLEDTGSNLQFKVKMIITIIWFIIIIIITTTITIITTIIINHHNHHHSYHHCNEIVLLLLGIEVVGNFQQIGPSTSLVDSKLPINTYECGIIRWWKNLGTALQALILIGAVVVLIGPCICCCYCCCRKNTPGIVIVPQPPPVTVISTNRNNVPMEPVAARAM
ncbi:hypothetical protein QZH41_012771, partial [Actinostola sp. cb2023]